MATQRIVVDPVTRIEGHLRVEVEAADGKIANAWTPCTQFRGIELVLRGRDPRDAWVFAQRICGVCTSIHALAAIYAVEDALQYPIPPQAAAIRNLISLAQNIQDHVIHFYHLQALDWVNVVNAAKADPAKAAALGASLSDWPLNGVGEMKQVQQRVKALLESGQLSIFTNGYWSHPAYTLPPEADLLGLAHYLQALDWQREMIKVHTIFGGKNPHPNFLVGGMAAAINMDNQWTINQVRLDVLNDLVEKTLAFVEQVYLPDVLAIGGFYKDYLEIGAANPNMMAVGLPGYAGAGRQLRPGCHGRRAAGRQLPGRAALRREQGGRVCEQRLVQLLHRQHQRAAALPGGDPARIHRPGAPVLLAVRPTPVLVDQAPPV